MHSPAGSASPSRQRKWSPERDRNRTPLDGALPSYNHFTSSPSVAAGVPVLELVRKFEEEKILTRDDRIALNEGLNDFERRDGIVKALRDLELGDGSRFAVRRLKALIHQNGIGEMTSRAYKEQQERLKSIESQQQDEKGEDASRAGGKELAVPQKDEAATASTFELSIDPSSEPAADPTSAAANSSSSSSSSSKTLRSPKVSSSPSRIRAGGGGRSGAGAGGDDRSIASSLPSLYDTQSAIEQAVGISPVYSDPDKFNICSKIARRLRDFLVRMKMAPTNGRRRFAVVVGDGSFNPLTRMHLRAYFVAKQYLEGKAGFIVLGSLLSPSHGMTVRERYRTHPAEILPAPHRLAIAQLMVQESKWLSVDPWDITRRRPMDYLSLLQHTKDSLEQQFPGIEIKVLYLCKPNVVPLLSPQSLRQEGFGVVVPCRATEYDQLKAGLSAKWNGLIWCVEDTAVLDASMDVVTSRKVRDKVRAYGSVEALVGTAIDQYFRLHNIGAKMNGAEEWTDEEKKLPEVTARPFLFTLKSQSMKSGVFRGEGSQAGPLTGVDTPAPVYTPSWAGLGAHSLSVPSSAATAAELAPVPVPVSVPAPASMPLSVSATATAQAPTPSPA